MNEDVMKSLMCNGEFYRDYFFKKNRFSKLYFLVIFIFVNMFF